MMGGGVYGVVAGVVAGAELFVAVGVGLVTSEAEAESDGRPGVLLGVEDGLLLGVAEGLPLGDPLSEEQGVGVGDAEAVDDAPADGPPPL
ncbi:MAG TPA: hypothetical protein VFB40_18030 [Actinocrinis sp.]|nr:hypothetical protein [Actinocrinis sp.]